jgi:hypothetical protein
VGVDIAVCFAERELSADTFLRARALSISAADAVYLALGRARPESGGRPFFSLWANEPVDLPGLCAELSERISPICVAWKSDHGGVAGYQIFTNGAETQNVAAANGDYLLLPSRGVEETFRASLQLAEGDRYGFPELLLDETVSCYLLRQATGGRTASPLAPDTVTRLLEADVEAEPVLPIEVA